jgi:hypothetical protein
MLVGFFRSGPQARPDPFAIFVGHELRDLPPDQVGHPVAEKPGEMLVGVDEDAALGNRDSFESGRRQPLESLLALADGLFGALAFDGGGEDGGRDLQCLDLGARPLALEAHLVDAQKTPPLPVGQDRHGGERLRPQDLEQSLLLLGEAADDEDERFAVPHGVLPVPPTDVLPADAGFQARMKRQPR